MSDSSEGLKTYSVHCHCNAVQFTMKLPDLATYEAVKCNCSICKRNGYVLGYPKWDDVNFDKGWDNLSEYRFGTKTRPQKFCKNCGSSMIIDFRERLKPGTTVRIAVNLRMVDGVDVDKLKVENLDGWGRMDPPYQHVAPPEEVKVEGITDRINDIKVTEKD